MKTFLVLLAAVVPASAGLLSVSRPMLTRLRDVGACFERRADAQADALGLPRRVCLDRVGTQVPADAPSPFAHDAVGVIEGAPAAGLRHIGGGARTPEGWDLVVNLLSTRAPRTVCGRLNSASASAYFPVDLEGAPLEGPVTVRGFLMDGSASCPGYARAVHFDYVPAP